jgi:Ohr subfamily peroxiredoxin
MKNLYIAQVTVTSGRDGGAVSSDGKLQLDLGFPKELGGDGAAANPEQLFAAGYAACFASSIKAAAAALQLRLSQVSVDGAATLSVREDGSYLVSLVTLTVHTEGLGDSAPRVIHEAQRICAYSNATSGNVVTDVVLA